MSSTLEQAIHAKRALFRKWKRQRTPESWRLFVTKRNEVTKALRKAEYRYIQSLHRNADNAPTSPDPVKEFWSFIKRSTGKQKSQQIPDLSATLVLLLQPLPTMLKQTCSTPSLQLKLIFPAVISQFLLCHLHHLIPISQTSLLLLLMCTRLFSH